MNVPRTIVSNLHITHHSSITNRPATMAAQTTTDQTTVYTGRGPSKKKRKAGSKKRKKREQKRSQTEMVVDHFNLHYGTSISKLEAWQAISRDLGADVGVDVDQCRKVSTVRMLCSNA